MKIAVLSDIHGNIEKINSCGKFLSQCDGIVVCGDISSHGEEKEIENVVKELKGINKNIFAIPGNMDGKHSIKILEKLGVNIHGKRVEFNGIDFVGCGGSTRSPFGTPFELDEGEIAECVLKNLKKPEKTIVVCHTPPFNTKTDKIMLGIHVGSKTLRKIVEEKQPLAFLCGHIHEASDIDYIGKTVVLNPGPFRRGGIGIVEIEENGIKAEIERF